MKKRLAFLLLLTAFLYLGFAPFAGAADLVVHHQGAVTLSNAPDYSWWYGCSPTSAGMMMGYYDINGYRGLRYDNLVPGGTAELSNYGNSGAITNSAIASSGHIADYWTGYGHSGDDPHPNGTHSFDSLADFMGTSQDLVGNVDGATIFYNRPGGNPVTWSEAEAESLTDKSGMYGMKEYVEYCGYSIDSLFNQYIFGYRHNTLGFTWADYMAEIDAGRVVMIHVVGHSMFGYGYDDVTGEMILNDTWYEDPERRMVWGGSYSGMKHYGVTCMTLSGGAAVPVPTPLILLGSGLLGLLGIRRRFNA